MIKSLQEKIVTIYNELNTKLLPENIKQDVEILSVTGTASPTGPVTQEEYDEAVATTEEILGITPHYTELEYIESTKTQWIDTGITYNHAYSMKTKFKFTSNTDISGEPFGARTVTNNTASKCMFISTYYDCWLAWGRTELSIASRYIGTSLWEVYFNKNRVYFNDSLIHTFTDENFSTDGSLYVFAEHHFNGDNGTDYVSYKTYSRIYYFQIYDENDNLLIDLIPVQRSGDNEICMYDKISKTFFTNQGTGTFIAGPVVQV